MEILKYTTDDFINAFGASGDDVDSIQNEAEKYNFQYQPLSPAEQDVVVQDINNKISSFSQVGAHRHDIWENCWSDAINEYEKEGQSPEALDPKFMGAHPIIRLHGQYVRPEDPRFETHWFRVYRKWLFSYYMPPFSNVMEFGCGSGFNLAVAAEMFPEKKFVGLDWSESSVRLVEKIAATRGYLLTGRQFDFFNPDHELMLGRNTIAMTFAALEQTGENFVLFADWLLDRKPGLVLSMEPILEFYDQDNSFDQPVIRYHTHRQYLNGYYSWLKEKETEGIVEIVRTHRPSFGSLYHEGYSLVVWRPI